MADEDMNAKTPNADASEIKRAKVEAVNKAEERSLYAPRKKIHPQRAKGKFRTIKWFMMLFTLGIYYIAPWIRWDRGEGMPDQAILIDIVGRRFYFFFIEIWPQEVYYVTGLMIMGGIALFLVTSTAGRMWCGYSCPQTIWTDLFLVVERFFEGERNARLRLDKAPWTFDKIRKRVMKHTVWVIIALMTGGAWIFYFADAPTLFMQLMTNTASFDAYLWMGLLATFTYVFGGLAREQVCTYMCPWPRIQAVMMDEETLAVMYRHDRGEPRGPHKKNETWDGRGDCVQCRQCIVVCPMGIDIRDGMQLECIQCSLCIDACNGIMNKIGRPEGLIAYDSLKNFERRKEGKENVFRIIRPRTIIYSIILAVVGFIMLFALLNRSLLDVNILRDRNPLYVQLSSGDIRNGYTIKIMNKSTSTQKYSVTFSGIENYNLRADGINEYDDNGNPIVTVERDKLRSLKFFVSAPVTNVVDSSMDVTFKIKELESGAEDIQSTTFKGPR
ncbi:cytochrome c oxidase accessory protein CcoG [Pseudemcibacter aquimaris]|uniref:cytochrome c oxidase accessory protein CcoG n=1 Tax=Pseudemcibacter aquimaris TaxID=2857064 RepID=UPI002011F6E0|nr:cytochrome c oxidase accessory protein CcoG [Pseudemcibacter aquimaris]MCC3862273.1 cytochrome c oxidase accessory protein CcoG [Pseudemcibacter aquimaris]WDU59023.1 cytochrome c oxidase accessory protein CcoG [Pseudemcibacter aquimaris]